MAREPAAAPADREDDFASAFTAGPRGGGGENKPAEKKLEAAEGSAGISIARAVRTMKDEQVGTRAGESVRTASGRTFLYRNGGWIDSEAVNGTPKQLKVKYLSDAYFALLKARPDLKAAIALGDRLVLVVAKDKSIVIDPAAGETAADKVVAFLK